MNLFLRMARNNPEGLISVSGRVSRVPRQSRRSVQIVFNRSPDADHGSFSRRWYEIAGVLFSIAMGNDCAYWAAPSSN